jgi:2-aminoadipate transaminase
MTATATTSRTLAAPSSFLDRFTAGGGFSDATLTSSAADAISLVSGIPDHEALPTAQLARAYARLQEDPDRLHQAFQYSGGQGIPALRQWIAAREGVSPDRILVTTGGQQGLSLAVRALIEQDALVAVDNPIFPIFLGVLEHRSRNLAPITVEADGIDVDQLEQRLAAGDPIRALYTVPDFHNPTQGSLSTEKRHRLAELADRYGFWIIADNPYREITFSGEHSDTAVFHDSENTVHVNTFSKTLGPGLRLGWLVLPERLVPSLTRLRNRDDSQTATLTQTLVTEVLNGEPEFFDANLVAARKRYQARARLLIDQLEEKLPGQFISSLPEGGYFLWARLADDRVDWLELRRAASTENLNYQPGAYFPSGPGTDSDRYLRFAYGDNSEERLVEAVDRLARAFETVRPGA